MELHEAVSTELELYRVPPVYFHRSDLAIGADFSDRLAEALFNSASMILIFVPAFFSERNIHGAQELLAMKRLEKQRLEHLPEGNRPSGLIIPVILRGSSLLPPLFNTRQSIDLSDFMLFDQKLSNNAVYAPRIQMIARYVYEYYSDLSFLPEEYGGDREDFSLPSIEETKQWLQEAPAPTQPFPFLNPD